MVVIAAIIVAGAVLGGAVLVANAVRASREEAARTRAASLLATFASAVGSAEHDPRVILVWEPLARMARRTWPQEFALLDGAGGSTFPFGRERLQAAHARWTTEWLAWERTHDAEYKMKAAIAEHELVAAGGAPHARAKLDAIESEKLDRYQKRYEETSASPRPSRRFSSPAVRPQSADLKSPFARLPSDAQTGRKSVSSRAVLTACAR